MLVPIFYFYRRFVFILSVILLRNNILVLILIQVGLIQFQLALLHLVKPLESRSTLWKQTLDECTYLILVSLLMCFTNFVADPEDRIWVGVAYISLMIANIGVHLIILILSTCKVFWLKLKRCFARRHLFKCCFFCLKKTQPKASHCEEPEQIELGFDRNVFGNEQENPDDRFGLLPEDRKNYEYYRRS